jgi:hypothetical protein
MLGSRYCHLHHSWGKALLGSIALLLVGAVLKPAAQQIWNKYFPSPDSKALRQLAREKPAFEFYVNGVKVPTNCLVPVPAFGELTTFSNASNLVLRISEPGELRVAVVNIGEGTADHLMLQLSVPATYTNTDVGSLWHAEPGFIGMQNGKLVANPLWLHWAHVADFPVAPGTMFSAPAIHLKRNRREDIVPVLISVLSRETHEARAALMLMWE